MRNLKRALSLALASVMLLGMMVVGTSAASYPDVSAEDNVEAIEVLNAVKVMVGDRGNFRPEDGVNRYEMAVITAKLLLGSEEADKYVVSGSFPFTDVPAAHWAYKYVAACYDYGVISGTSSTTYSGTQSLTATQAALIMLRALGYEELTKGATDWRAPVVKQAKLINLFKGVASNPNAKLNRNQVAQLALNTLESDVVITIDNSNTVTTPDGTVVNMGQPDYSGRVADNSNYDGGGEGRQQLVEKLYGSKLKKDDTNETTDYGLPATKWTYPNAATVIGKYASDEPVYTWAEKIEDITKGDLEKVLGVTTALEVYENGTDTSSPITPIKGDKTKVLTAYKGATIYAVDATGNDGKADRLCVVYPYLAKVTKVTEAKGNDDRKITMDVWADNAGSKITGVTYETEDFAKDDYVLVFPGDKMSVTEAWSASSMSADIIEIKPVTETVTGKITVIGGTNGSAVTDLTVDGAKYKNSGMANMGLTNGATVAAGSYGFKNEYTLFLSNGYILGVKGEAEAASLDDVVYVTRDAFDTKDKYGVTTYFVETVALDGTVEVVENYGWFDSDAGSGGARQPSNQYYYSHTTDQDSDGDHKVVPGFYTTDYDSATKSYKFTPVSKDKDAITGNVKFAYADVKNDPTEMKTSSISLALNDGADDITGYLTSTTRILFVKAENDGVKVSTETGAIRQSLVQDNTLVLFSKDGSTYEIEAIVIKDEQVNVDDEVFYVDATDRGTAEHGHQYRLYNLSTGEYETVVATTANVAAEVTAKSGYVTYTVDKDGVYTFKGLTALTASGENKDGAYSVTGTGFSTYNGTICTASGSATIKDLSVDGVEIINLTGDSDNDGLTVTDLAADETQGFAAKIYAKDEKVVAIVLTSFAGEDFQAAAPTVTLTGVGDITVAGDKTTAKTLTAGTPIAVAGWATNTDNMTLAVTQADAGNTCALTTTTVTGTGTGVTYTNNDGKIVIEADNQTVTITVTVTNVATGVTTDYVYTATVGNPA